MPGTPLIAFSIGEATVCSTVVADAPGYTACTVTTGGAISGYCATGSARMDASPAMMKNVAITAAKMGRSMKKRENMKDPDQCFVAPAAAPASFAGALAASCDVPPTAPAALGPPGALVPEDFAPGALAAGALATGALPAGAPAPGAAVPAPPAP